MATLEFFENFSFTFKFIAVFSAPHLAFMTADKYVWAFFFANIFRIIAFITFYLVYMTAGLHQLFNFHFAWLIPIFAFITFFIACVWTIERSRARFLALEILVPSRVSISNFKWMTLGCAGMSTIKSFNAC